MLSIKKHLIAVFGFAGFAHEMFAAAACRQALAADSVREPAVAYAHGLMRSRHLVAVSVVRQLSTRTLVLIATSEPVKLQVSTPVLPLSLSKVFTVTTFDRRCGTGGGDAVEIWAAVAQLLESDEMEN